MIFSRRQPCVDLSVMLRQSHARMYRMALALCGDRWRAEEVVEKVLARSGDIAHRWTSAEQGARWFSHYTLLLSRDNASVELSESDVLLKAAADEEAAAVVRAIRRLPMQQREAFLLHHGETMDLRQIATAMDCSTAAAANHLAAAAQTLKASGLPGLGDFTLHLPDMLRQLMPDADALQRDLLRAMDHQRTSQRLRMIQRVMVKGLIVLAILWLLYWIGQMLGFIPG